MTIKSSEAYELGWNDSHNGLPRHNPYDSVEEGYNYDDYNHGYDDEEFANDRYSFAG